MIKVMIVDDDPFIRQSLQVLIGMDPDIEVIGAASDGNEALNLLQAGNMADVILMDIRMPGCGGVEGTEKLSRLFLRFRY